jgi:hypothetical protein
MSTLCCKAGSVSMMYKAVFTNFHFILHKQISNTDDNTASSKTGSEVSQLILKWQ